MIVFCEDCGEKNDLPPSALAGGRAVFQCSTCCYPNAYPVNVRETVLTYDADRFLNIIRSFSEIVGAFLYDIEKKVVGTQMPAMLTQNDIETLGSGLVRSHKNGVSNCPDIETMMVVISNKHFFVHRVNATLYSVIVTTTPSLPDGLLKRILGPGKENV